MTAKNNPLGAKWQHGVNHTMVMDADPLIITGSDDILSINFLKNIVPLSSEYGLIGLRSWYIYHKEKLWHFNYKAINGLFLGGGRIYSKKFLDSIGWKIFDTSANKLLDDRGFYAAMGKTYMHSIHSPEILAIKGAWPTLNPFTTKHRNIEIVANYSDKVAKQIMKEKFNYYE